MYVRRLGYNGRDKLGELGLVPVAQQRDVELGQLHPQQFLRKSPSVHTIHIRRRVRSQPVGCASPYQDVGALGREQRTARADLVRRRQRHDSCCVPAPAPAATTFVAHGQQ